MLQSKDSEKLNNKDCLSRGVALISANKTGITNRQDWMRVYGQEQQDLLEGEWQERVQGEIIERRGNLCDNLGF